MARKPTVLVQSSMADPRAFGLHHAPETHPAAEGGLGMADQAGIEHRRDEPPTPRTPAETAQRSMADPQAFEFHHAPEEHPAAGDLGVKVGQTHPRETACHQSVEAHCAEDLAAKASG